MYVPVADLFPNRPRGVGDQFGDPNGSLGSWSNHISSPSWISDVLGWIPKLSHGLQRSVNSRGNWIPHYDAHEAGNMETAHLSSTARLWDWDWFPGPSGGPSRLSSLTVTRR